MLHRFYCYYTGFCALDTDDNAQILKWLRYVKMGVRMLCNLCSLHSMFPVYAVLLGRACSCTAMLLSGLHCCAHSNRGCQGCLPMLRSGKPVSLCFEAAALLSVCLNVLLASSGLLACVGCRCVAVMTGICSQVLLTLFAKQKTAKITSWQKVKFTGYMVAG